MKGTSFVVFTVCFAGLLALGGLSFRLYRDVEALKVQVNKKTSTPLINDQKLSTDQENVPQESASEEVAQVPVISDLSAKELAELRKYIDTSIATIAATKKDTQIVSTPTPKIQTTYISMGSTFTSTATDWVDVSDSGVYIDLLNDYSSSAKVTWEVSLKVANSNGQAFARLWDDSNKIAVAGSEISTVNNSEFKQVASGNLAFWRGRNLYKVQVKSLNSFVVTMSGGKIKIVY